MQENRPTVLIVDDAPSNIDVLRNILAADYQIRVALNGENALRIAQKEPPPDIILLDVVMPEIDGYEVCRQLKANENTAAIPVLLVTGTADGVERRKGLNLGAAAFIMKPLDAQDVLSLVAQHSAKR